MFSPPLVHPKSSDIPAGSRQDLSVPVDSSTVLVTHTPLLSLSCLPKRSTPCFWCLFGACSPVTEKLVQTQFGELQQRSLISKQTESHSPCPCALTQACVHQISVIVGGFAPLFKCRPPTGVLCGGFQREDKNSLWLMTNR